MKKLLLLLLTLPLAMRADDIDALIQRLSTFGERIPQEKVYLHMDNTCYFVGDTIRFAAYTRQTNNGAPSTVSGVLYVELLNDDGYLVERQLIEMKEGRGHGTFVLDSDSYGGFYELRAYTRWQLNWGITERPHSRTMQGLFLNKDFENRYFRDYDKLYSRVFPVYDAPLQPGAYMANMSTRPMRRVLKSDPDAPRLTLSFYPEGGNLVQGIESTIAFEAAWSDGKQAQGTLDIDGQQVTTEHRGRSTFQFTPTDQSKHTLTFTDADGHTAQATLPKAEPRGANLHLWQSDAGWKMRFTATPDMPIDSLAWTVMHEGRLQCSGRLREQMEVTLPQDLPAGVLQATLFDHQGRVWADRLFFVTTPALSQPRLTVSGVKARYQPYEPIDLQVHSTQSSRHVSLAVRDGSLSDALFDNGDMLTEMLLCSEIKGFVPNPGWYFQSDDQEHRRGLDLLMLTQGWRRFVWHHMAVSGSWDLTQPNEYLPVLTGEVYDIDETPFYGIQAIHSSANRDALWTSDYNYVLNYFDPTYNYGEYVPSLLDDQGIAADPGSTPPSFPVSTRANDGITKFVVPATNLRDDSRHNQLNIGHKRDVLVHIEATTPDGKSHLSSEDMTRDGRFHIQLPRTYQDYILFVSASDPSKWTKKQKANGYNWIQRMPNESDLPQHRARHFRVEASQHAVRVHFPYPRYVQPYDHYQRHIQTAFDPLGVAPDMVYDEGSTTLHEVVIKNRRSRFNRLDESKPAFIIDAYDAYNQALDAGMKNAEPEMIARTLLGTYGQEDPFISKFYPDGEHGVTTRSSNLRVRYGYDQLRRHLNDVTTDRDSVYVFDNLHSTTDLQSPTFGKFFFHTLKDKYVIYTDYCPRHWGSRRYAGSDLPETNIGVYLFPDDTQRIMYRDRRYIMPGFSVAEEQYQPDYSQRRPDDTPADYRRTLYWNPDLQLDAQGQADVHLWNSSRTTTITVSAETPL